MKKTHILLLLFFAANTFSLLAQEKLPVLHAANQIDLNIIVDGEKEPGSWILEPKIRPDVFETTGRQVKFCSKTDTLSFYLSYYETQDFWVVRTGKDSAMIRIKCIPENQFENPSPQLKRLKPSGFLTKKQAIFDLDALVYTLGQVHPNMFATCNQGEFFSMVERAKAQMPDSLSIPELYRVAAPIVSALGDGHTILRFPYNSLFTKKLKRMPMYVGVGSNCKLYAKRCVDNLIPQGSEILSINKTSSGEMIKEMEKYVSGERDFYRLERVDEGFTALFELLYPAKQFVVVYREKPTQKIKTITLEAATIDEYRNRMPQEEKQDLVPDYSFKIDKKAKVCIMDFRSFRNPGNMKSFADSMFHAMKELGIKNLIIDIRENGGGSSAVGDTLFKYISPKPFTQFGKSLMRISPSTKKLASNPLTPIGWYYYENKTLEKPYSEVQGHFSGNVYLLVSHHTFSSASSFAWAFKEFGMGKIIGEETGGMNVCFGDILSYALPISELHCSISFKRFWQYGADESRIHGTLPDVVAEKSMALEAALTLIRKTRQETN